MRSGKKLAGSPKKIKRPDLAWHIDYLNADGCGGWIFDRNNIFLEIQIDIYVNDKLVDKITASNIREDLATLGINSFSHGFNIQFSKYFKGYLSNVFRAEVVYGKIYTLIEEQEFFDFQEQIKSLTDLQVFLREQKYDLENVNNSYLVKSYLPAIVNQCRVNTEVPNVRILENNSEGYQKSIAIIIPIYMGVKETINCLNSVLESKSRHDYRLVAINDRSPDLDMQTALEQLHGKYH